MTSENKNFKRYLDEIPVCENEDFAIYGSSELEPYKYELLDFLQEKKTAFLAFFKLLSFEKVPVNLFAEHEMYLKFTRQFYEPAPYSQGNFTNGSINYTYDVDQIPHLKSALAHELAHLFYETIWRDNYERVLWLDEGLAQYLSGEKSALEAGGEKFKSWYLCNIVNYHKEIPDIAFLKRHGNKYGQFVDDETRKYNGYDLSYLLVRFCRDSRTDIPSLLASEEKIKALEKTIMQACLAYYNEVFKVDVIKDSLCDVSSPTELMDFMDKNLIYGWVDKQGVIHKNNLKDLRELYRSGSLEETLTLKVGTCIEQANLIKYFLSSLGMETKLFCYRRYETDDCFDEDIKMHCFVLYSCRGSWFHFEYSNQGNKGIHQYGTLDEALKSEINKRPQDDIRVLTEIPNIPSGLTFKEFNAYVNSFEAISIDTVDKVL